jgi:hypothetical protein
MAVDSHKVIPFDSAILQRRVVVYASVVQELEGWHRLVPFFCIIINVIVSKLEFIVASWWWQGPSRCFPSRWSLVRGPFLRC